MINLRYHIVSITAVFLALAIGVVMGTSFLGKATVDQLKTQISKAERRIDATEKVNSRLTAEIKRLEDRNTAMRQQGPQLLAEHLTGDPVLIIASAGVDQQSLSSLQSTLEATAADFKGTLVVTPKMRLAGNDATKMADLLKLPSNDRTVVRRTLTARFAAMLATAGHSSSVPPPITQPTTTTSTTTTSPFDPNTSTTTTTTTTPTSAVRKQPQLLTDLRDGGWLAYQPPQGGSADDQLLTTRGYRYVVVSGAGADVPDQEFILPVVTDLGSNEPTPMVVASAAVGDDPEQTRLAIVGAVRDSDPLNKNVSTVDDLESFDGDAAVVLALEDVPAVHGHYGVGDGATSLLPPPA